MNHYYLSPNDIPSVLASLIISSSGDTYLSFPALSESGIAVTLLSRNTTSLPKSLAFMSSAAFAPNLDDITLSYASGLPPLCVCPGMAILISCVVYAFSLSASSYATDGIFYEDSLSYRSQMHIPTADYRLSHQNIYLLNRLL